MRKNVVVISIAIMILFIFIYNYNVKSSTKGIKYNENNIKEERYMYLSYIELGEYLNGKDIDGMKSEIDKIIENLEKDKFNNLLLHVRSFSDAIYISSIYPSSIMIMDKETNALPFDILDYFIESAHKRNIKVHAWINPYRIRSTTDVKSITVKNPAYKWIGSNNVTVIKDKGIYYNPASSDVLELLKTGVKEIVDNYNIDGIHFDDYFYPDDEIDKVNYQDYLDDGGNLSMEDYRYEVILNMIEEVNKVIKSSNKNVLFGIAPEGNIENNYEVNYLDIEKLLKSDYIDYIMPQVYYGFLNESKPFIETLNYWNSLITGNIKLIPALALYKSGSIDNYAYSGKNEWINYNNIITNQIKVSRNMSNYSGYAIYRYDDFYNPNNKNKMLEVENYRSLLKIIENEN